MAQSMLIETSDDEVAGLSNFWRRSVSDKILISNKFHFMKWSK